MALPSSPESVGPEWAAQLRLLPGFDPFRSAGGAWFDHEAASEALGFIGDCVRHVEGALAGQTLKLEPWQRSWVANLFGWKRSDRQARTVRRFRETLLYVPRKNGKTPMAAAVALYVLFCDGERGMQGYIAAADAEQAGILFRQCKGMVDQEEEMSSRCEAFGGTSSAAQSRSLVRNDDGSFLRVISAVADTKHGGNSHLIVIDELHAQPDRDLVDVLSTSMASLNRPQPLFISLTTADFDRPSICNEKLDYARKVRDGIIDDPAFLPAVYEAAQDADWRSPDVWRAANPNLGVSVSEEYLEAETRKAAENPAYENTVKRLHLNMKTATASKAIDPLMWDACASPVPDADLAGRPCWGGLDLASTSDIASFSLLWRIGSGPDRWAHRAWMWSPKATARRRTKKDRVPYEAWASIGHLTLTEGDVIDYDVIRRDINALGERFNIKEIAADRWNSTQLLTQLAGDGYEVIAYGQGYRDMTAPTKELLDLIASGRLAHQGSPVMRWMALNMAVEEDAAGNKKPSKKKSADKIDGPVSAIMALGRAMLNPEAGSVYDTRGIEAL